MAVCSILIPSDPYRNSHGFDTTEIDLGCVRKAGHVGPHLIKLPDGNYLSWEDDLECTDCYPRECECYVLGVISKTEALAFAEESEVFS